ncbi:c-1-tetrahydrofolate synthase [Anaeramoeba flamelloides]|uniref:C-1-tetrahydrofolate synthase n=1 Tax=Anaeramoeba flamelloides TaxID=1746091 RepID=A0ABQ8YBX9_9EUKA|nr:c-1-tetrahydrofolate synthase [Anaeramoeba flamelloides]
MSQKEKPKNIIDGRKISRQVKEEVKEKIEELKKLHGKSPGLAVIIVGDRPDSRTYVNMKKKACAFVGIQSFERKLEVDVTQEELLKIVREYNENPEINGILVQLPLPKHIDEEEVLSQISLTKDVDGFSPYNIGKCAMKGRDPLFFPCTPYGCIQLLKRSNVEISGKEAVIIGRSNIVGLPVSFLLLKENATITICHSRTKDIASTVKRADIIIAAVGIPKFVKAEWVKEGAVIIDVGINSVEDKTRKSGRRLVGDVDFENVKEKASLITPVPGGVGPMTVAMLMVNTLRGFERTLESEQKEKEKEKEK